MMMLVPTPLPIEELYDELHAVYGVLGLLAQKVDQRPGFDESIAALVRLCHEIEAEIKVLNDAFR